MAFSDAQVQVAIALKELNGCSDSVKQLLLAALPNAFGSDKHQFQTEAAVMLRKALEDGRAAAGEAQIAASQRLEESKTSLEALQADAEASASSEEAARAVLADKVAAVETARATVKQEKTMCDDAQSSKAEVAAERQTHEAAKAEVESVQNGMFRMLLDGGWEDEEVRDAGIDAVCGFLSNDGVDAVLLAALPKALACKPTNAGPFDKMAVEEASRIFSEKVAACDAKLAEGQENFEDITAEHLGASAILDVARETELAANEVRDQANTAVQTAVVEKKLAKSKVMDQKVALEAVAAEELLAAARVQQLDVALTSLAQLEAGEPMEVDQENKENAENTGSKLNVMLVDDASKGDAMVVDQTPVGVTA